MAKIMGGSLTTEYAEYTEEEKVGRNILWQEGFLTTICLKFAVRLVHFVSAISGQLGEGAGGGAGRFNDQSLRT
jgi:hypothetical protein